MGKLYSFIAVSADGYHEAPGRDIGWHHVDEDFDRFSVEQLDATGALAFGRVTYELMASFWPTELAAKEDPEVAGRMNAKPKLVVSKTLRQADWAGTRIVRDDLPGAFARLRRELDGGDIGIFGSSVLTAHLLAEGVLDELRLMVMPVALGAGTPVLAGLPSPARLDLVATRSFASGNVLHTYRPSGA
ncbi:dihydrofolate reductase family protein [Saccharomonospora sp. NPDC006951]